MFYMGIRRGYIGLYWDLEGLHGDAQGLYKVILGVGGVKIRMRED